MISIDHAPCKNGVNHTSYILAEGPKEGEVQPFPKENWDLTSDDHQKHIREELQRRNLTLVIPEI